MWCMSRLVHDTIRYYYYIYYYTTILYTTTMLVLYYYTTATILLLSFLTIPIIPSRMFVALLHFLHRRRWATGLLLLAGA